MRLPHLTFGRLLAGTAVFLIWTGGTAYAAATITGADIVNETVESVDVKNESIKGVDVLDTTIRSTDVGDNTLTSADILNGTITDADLADNSVESGEVLDYSLSNQDVGVLFALVKADGTLSKGSNVGDIQVTRFDVGAYYVEFFDHQVSSCAFTATHGPAGALTGSPSAAIAQVSDDTSDDGAAWVHMSDGEGNPVDAPFHLVVVC